VDRRISVFDESAILRLEAVSGVTCSTDQ